MSESLIAVLGILASAICGGLVVYYWFKDTIESQKNKIQQFHSIAKDKRAIEVKLIGAEHLNKQLTETNQSLSQELKRVRAINQKSIQEINLNIDYAKDIDELCRIRGEMIDFLESELAKYKTRRAKIKFTEQQNKEIISMRKRGYSFRVIASKLGISRETIRIHFNKLTGNK